MAEIDLDKEIQKVGHSAYSFKLAGDDVEVGDKVAVNFKPCLKLNRWGTECYLKVWLMTTKKVKESLWRNQIKWVTQDMELCFYPLKIDKESEHGGVEFEIILKKKPAGNIITLNIETQGLKFYYQPPLTEEEWPKGYIITETEAWDEDGHLNAHRPEKVVGSYAVYHKTQDKFLKTKEEAQKYRAGMAFQIYRPIVTDAKESKIWAELNIDEGTGVLTITVDQSWLDNAVYPVRIDPDFGYKTKGGTTSNPSSYVYGCLFGSGGSGEVQSITWWLRNFSADTAVLAKVALYNASKGLVEKGEDTLSAAYDNWFTILLDSTPIIDNADYWLTTRTDVPTPDIVQCYYTSTAGWNYMYKSLALASFPEDPLAGTFSTGRKYSVYCSYEEVSAEEPTIFFSHNF